jgi:hypothetical protein
MQKRAKDGFAQWIGGGQTWMKKLIAFSLAQPSSAVKIAPRSPHVTTKPEKMKLRAVAEKVRGGIDETLT